MSKKVLNCIIKRRDFVSPFGFLFLWKGVFAQFGLQFLRDFDVAKNVVYFIQRREGVPAFFVELGAV